MSTRRTIWTMLTLLAVKSLIPAAQAQQPAASATQPDTIPFVDVSFGFELRLPSGWAYDRTGFFGPGESVGLLRGKAADGRATLQVLIFPNAGADDFQAWLETFAQIAADIGDARVGKADKRTLAGRESAIVAIESRFGVDSTLTLYGCVPLDPTTVWVLTYSTLIPGAADDAAARLAFERVISTLRVTYDPQTAEPIRAQLKNGQTFREKRLRPHLGGVFIDPAQRTFEIFLGGKAVGYLTRQAQRERASFDDPRFSDSGKVGVRVRERSWRFAEDGSAQHTRVDLFVSDDLESELAEMRSVQIPADPRTPALIKIDQYIRERNVLFSTMRTSADTGLREPRNPIRVGSTYLGLAIVRMLPTLLGVGQSDPLAFSIYDAETRALITHVIQPLGPKPLPERPGETANAFETREGLVGRPATVYTDADGALLRIEARELLLKYAEEDAIEKRYGPRRDAAEARLSQPRPEAPAEGPR